MGGRSGLHPQLATARLGCSHLRAFPAGVVPRLHAPFGPRPHPAVQKQQCNPPRAQRRASSSEQSNKLVSPACCALSISMRAVFPVSLRLRGGRQESGAAAGMRVSASEYPGPEMERSRGGSTSGSGSCTDTGGHHQAAAPVHKHHGLEAFLQRVGDLCAGDEGAGQGRAAGPTVKHGMRARGPASGPRRLAPPARLSSTWPPAAALSPIQCTLFSTAASLLIE